MEQLLVNISDALVGEKIKTFLKTQKGVNFSLVFINDFVNENERHQQIMDASDAAHAGEKGILLENLFAQLKVEKQEWVARKN